ncbi:hypothetical protein [Candidatus Pelagibacter sp. HIMB1495]|uniref:hypothetical protein n=1 Tax=unclassified Candidatus Pelagibacter TaxID=2647897 RepID=UPI003F849452
MKRIFVYLTILIFSFNNISYANNLNNYFGIDKFICDQNNNFDNFIECLEDKLTIQAKYKNSFEYRKDAINFLNMNFIYADLVNEKIINNNKAYELYEQLIEADNDIILKDLENLILSSKCLDKGDFPIFINCINEEFRTYPIYQKNNLENKARFEEMMFNLLMNINGKKIVFVDLNKEKIEFNENEGFKYFELMLDKISQNLFINDGGVIIPDQEVVVLVDKSEQIRDTLILIVAIIAISYVASKVVPKVIDKLTASSGSSSTSAGSTSVSAPANSYSYSQPGQFLPNLFRNVPNGSILRQAHFKKLLVSGRLGF